jgi:hypothetical protein
MIDSRPCFIYGHIVTTSNNEFCFDEGAGELIAKMNPGGYSFAEYVTELQRALRAAGTQDYVVSANRSVLAITITAPIATDLLIASGSSANSGYQLAGFTGADLSSVTTATSNAASGYKYKPQFLIQSYVDSEHFQQSAFQTLNRTQSGREELIRFGVDKFVEMDIKFVTNKVMDGVVIRSNPTGVEDAVRFLQYATQKQRIELFIDENNLSTPKKVILGSSPGSSDGTGYRLRELVDKGLRDIYDIGVLQFRVVG